MNGPVSPSAWYAGVVLWIAAIVCGMVLLVRYSLTAGPAGRPPEALPAAYRGGSGDALTLVMAVHPRCPCTRAALDELEGLLAASRGRLAALLLFVQPDGVDEPWARTDTWRRARALPGVRAELDRGGRAAARLGFVTSSHVALYDAAGALRFQGGITGARGMIGPNAGREAVAAVVAGSEPRAGRTPVFGCPLATPPAAARHEPCGACP